ncbi:MAG TPA: glycosyltransferase [Anaerolineae bacterium]|nr:glycosyltransferase [Anaerolineae bacterium]
MLKVSVCIQTYNHRPFIAQALDSVLMQETDFDYEIVLGEDESQDGTRQICIDYAGRYPNRIRLFLRSRKDVIYIDGRPTGRFNFTENLKAAPGEYIALLEGDDYWTDPRKLQRQVDFLEAHPECSMCFHGFTVRFEDGSRPPHVPAPPSGSIFSLEDVLVANFIGTLTVMFRRRATQELPDWYFELAIGDWPLHILNAQYGDIGYIDSVMAVYRVHSAGIWSGKSHVQRAKAALEMYHHLRSYLGARYQKIIKAGMAKACLALAAAYADEENIGEARRNLWRSVAECPMNGLRQLVDVVALALRLYTPRIHRLLKKLWVGSEASV